MKIKYGFIVIGLCGLFVSSSVYAQSLTDSGLTFKKTRTKTEQFFTTVIALNDNPGTSTAVYNDADGTADAAGAINVTSYNKEVSIEWHVPTLGSTGIDLTLLGRFGTDTGWALLHTISIDTTTGTSTHGSLTIEEKPMHFKVGRQATGVAGTDDISIWVRGTGWAE